MKRHWDEQELAAHWSLAHDEFELVRNRTDHSRIGFAALLKFFQIEGRFPPACDGKANQSGPEILLDAARALLA